MKNRATTAIGAGVTIFLLVALLVCWAASSVLAADPSTFEPAVNYKAGTSPRGVATADVNKDGVLDLIVANRDTSNVSVLLGTGSGQFAPAANYPAGNYPASVVAADFNGDGNLDLAVTNQFPDGISVLLGDGTGAFGAPASYSGGAYPYGLVAGDFDKDGSVDLVTTNYNTSKKISAIDAYGDGSFKAPVSYTAAQLYPTGLAAADFNGDGNADLAVANNNSNNVSIIPGKTDGTFDAAAAQYLVYPVGASPRSVAVGDFNGDGNLDVAVSNASSNSVSILLGHGDLTFTVQSTTYQVGTNPRSITAGDFNLDGKVDLAVANKSATDNISVLMGNGDGTFDPAVNYTGGNSPDGPQAIIAADFNSDGRTDIAVANYTSGDVSVLLNSTPYPCTPAQPSLSLDRSRVHWASYADYTAKLLSVDFILNNVGSNDAYAVTIVGSVNTNGVVPESMPVSVGDVAAGASGNATVKYVIPTGVSSFYTTIYATAQDACGASYAYPTAMPGA